MSNSLSPRQTHPRLSVLGFWGLAASVVTLFLFSSENAEPVEDPSSSQHMPSSSLLKPAKPPTQKTPTIPATEAPPKFRDTPYQPQLPGLGQQSTRPAQPHTIQSLLSPLALEAQLLLSEDTGLCISLALALLVLLYFIFLGTKKNRNATQLKPSYNDGINPAALRDSADGWSAKLIKPNKIVAQLPAEHKSSMMLCNETTPCFPRESNPSPDQQQDMEGNASPGVSTGESAVRGFVEAAASRSGDRAASAGLASTQMHKREAKSHGRAVHGGGGLDTMSQSTSDMEPAGEAAGMSQTEQERNVTQDGEGAYFHNSQQLVAGLLERLGPSSASLNNTAVDILPRHVPVT